MARFDVFRFTKRALSAGMTEVCGQYRGGVHGPRKLGVTWSNHQRCLTMGNIYIYMNIYIYESEHEESSNHINMKSNHQSWSNHHHWEHRLW